MNFPFLKKLIRSFQKKIPGDSLVIRKDVIENNDEAENLWLIYNSSFKKLNEMSPCKQSFNREHFLEILKSPTVRKYIAKSKLDGSIIGLGLVSNDLKNSPWISEEYFQENYPKHHEKSLVYYFLGIAVHEDHRKKGHSLAMLNYITADIPKGAIMGFDHSHNINPFLHHFTKIIKNSRSVKRKYLDRQHYHIIHFQ